LGNKQYKARMRFRSGFTLIELSVVLVVVALLLSFAVSVGKTRIETQRYQVTYERMKLIDEAIDTFIRDHKRLPCPADPNLAVDNPYYGWEFARNTTEPCYAPNMYKYDTATIDTTICLAGAPPAVTNWKTCGVHGAVPARDLNLNPVDTLDGWGNKIIYEVSAIYATADGYQTGETLSDDFEQMDIYNANWFINGTNYNNFGSGSHNVYYFLLSNGPNKSFSFSSKAGGFVSYGDEGYAESLNSFMYASGEEDDMILLPQVKKSSSTTYYNDDIIFYRVRHLLQK
jgi:prepilin-type N-terminal cleavage/methylation domain-containing protein